MLYSSKTTVLSQSIQLDSKVQSIELTPHLQQLYAISHKLQNLNNEKQGIKHDFQTFKDHILQTLNKTMGKISSMVYRLIQTKVKVQKELGLQQNRNQKMKKQVLQLREMIQQFIRNQSQEVQQKDREIAKLKQQIHQLKQQYSYPKNQLHQNLVQSHLQENQMMEKSYYDTNDHQLQIIQQVTQYTGSVSATPSLSTIKNSLAFLNNDNQDNNNRLSFRKQNEQQPIFINNSQYVNTFSREQGSNKKVKKYLNFFREEIDQNANTHEFDGGNGSYEDFQLVNSDNINLPTSIKSPRKMEFMKKDNMSKRTKSLISEEQDKQNSNCFELSVMTPHTSKKHERNKSSSLQKERRTQHRYEILISKSATKQRRSSKDSKQSEQRLTRSNTRTNSKQKIKVTSKLIEEENNNNYSIKFSKKPLKLRPSVHLGGKAHMKKLAKDIRVALQELKIWEGDRCREVKYEGEKRNNMRWGRGRVIFDNGITYEGEFVQNYRHGHGKLFINGIQLYDGQWCLNEFSGEGYLKSLKNLSQKCPKILHQASYCGQLLQNKLHGMGTLFINQNEKFVGKFVHGVPVGQYTYYNHSDIEFGNWF